MSDKKKQKKRKGSVPKNLHKAISDEKKQKKRKIFGPKNKTRRQKTLDEDSIPLFSTRKLALQFGLIYRNTKSELFSCIEDVKNTTKKFLLKEGFSTENCVHITDDTSIKPNLENMMILIKKFVTNSIDGDRLVLQYSGHGTEVPDDDGDEGTKDLNRKDEAIVPLDHENGIIVDDWLFENVVRSLEAKPKTSLFILMDCCNSGTIFDLQYQYYATRTRIPVIKKVVGTTASKRSKSNVLCASAALDPQLADDDGWIKQSAFTRSFLKIYAEHEKKKKTFREFILGVDKDLSSNGHTHQCVFSSTRPIDLDEKCDFWIANVT